MDTQDINNNEFLKQIIASNSSFSTYLKSKIERIDNNPKIKNINALRKKLKEVNSEENLISLIGELEVCNFFLKINVNSIDVGGRELPNKKRVDLIVMVDDKEIFVEIKSPQVKLNKLLNTTGVIRLYDEESIKTITSEVIEKKQLSEDNPNLLVFYLGHSIADKDDFDAVYEHIVTNEKGIEIRREGLFYKKKDGRFFCNLISGILAIKDSACIVKIYNPNVDSSCKIDNFFDLLKES